MFDVGIIENYWKVFQISNYNIFIYFLSLYIFVIRSVRLCLVFKNFKEKCKEKKIKRKNRNKEKVKENEI